MQIQNGRADNCSRTQILGGLTERDALQTEAFLRMEQECQQIPEGPAVRVQICEALGERWVDETADVAALTRKLKINAEFLPPIFPRRSLFRRAIGLLVAGREAAGRIQLDLSRRRLSAILRLWQGVPSSTEQFLAQ